MVGEKGWGEAAEGKDGEKLGEDGGKRSGE